LSVDVEQICAKLLAGVNFEQVHAELMAALEGIAAGKGHCDFIEVLPVGTTTKIFDALQRAVQFLCEPFESNATETAQKSARDHFFYFSGATPSAVRYQNWKMYYTMSQPGADGWLLPLIPYHMTLVQNIKRDPFEQAVGQPPKAPLT
jgi:hypothetical protein